MRKAIAAVIAAAILIVSPGPIATRAMAAMVNGSAARGAATGKSVAPVNAFSLTPLLSVPGSLTSPSLSASALPIFGFPP